MMKIGTDTHKSGKMKQKGQMEIGHSRCAGVKPLQGRLQITVKQRIGLLYTKHMTQKFGQEQNHGRLDRIERYICIYKVHARIVKLRQTGGRTDFQLTLHKSQRTPQSCRQTGFPASTRYRSGERKTAMSLAVQIDNLFVVIILDSTNHYSTYSLYHFRNLFLKRQSHHFRQSYPNIQKRIQHRYRQNFHFRRCKVN